MAKPVDPFEQAYDEFIGGETQETVEVDPAEDPPEDDIEPDEGGEDEDGDLDVEDVDEDVEGDPDGPDDEGDEQQVDDPTRIEVTSDDAVVVLPDGTEVPVKDGAFRHADYTKKTQELAERRREVDEREQQVSEQYERLVSWVEERQQDPAGWAVEVIAGSQEPTVALARAMKQLAAQGKLEARFVEAFGLESGEIAELADQGEREDRLSQIERQMQEREQAERAAREHATKIAEFKAQYERVTDGLTFETAGAEMEFRQELLTYAKDNQIPNLELAYKAWAFENGKTPTGGPAPSVEERQPDPEVQKKKRAARSVARSSAADPGRKKQESRPRSTEEAARAVVEEAAARA